MGGELVKCMIVWLWPGAEGVGGGANYETLSPVLHTIAIIIINFIIEQMIIILTTNTDSGIFVSGYCSM